MYEYKRPIFQYNEIQTRSAVEEVKKFNSAWTKARWTHVLWYEPVGGSRFSQGEAGPQLPTSNPIRRILIWEDGIKRRLKEAGKKTMEVFPHPCCMHFVAHFEGELIAFRRLACGDVESRNYTDLGALREQGEHRPRQGDLRGGRRA